MQVLQRNAVRVVRLRSASTVSGRRDEAHKERTLASERTVRYAVSAALCLAVSSGSSVGVACEAVRMTQRNDLKL